MFRHQGPGRSDRQNSQLAACLAFIGGFVNSAGFVLIGSFTSHVTGNVGRFANDIASQQLDAAAAALTMITAFFAGAFLVSTALESDFFGHAANAYGIALIAEALLLFLFATVSMFTVNAHPRLRDMEAAILCAAMGMQNSLVTRLSGAVVRTTHLTGVITDLGIEAARWFRWWRGRLSNTLRIHLAFGHNPPERPLYQKAALLMTILISFLLGAVLGAIAGVRLHAAAMLLPSASVLALSVYAFLCARRDRDDAPTRAL